MIAERRKHPLTIITLDGETIATYYGVNDPRNEGACEILHDAEDNKTTLQYNGQVFPVKCRYSVTVDKKTSFYELERVNVP